MPKPPTVQRDDLLAGVELCMDKGQELLESSLLLIDAGKLESAANTFSLGAQEVGKAKLLRDAYDTGDPRPEITGFYDHYAKIDAARSVLGSSALWLKDGAFDHRVFDPRVFDVGVPADEPTRLDVLYVNYGSTGWLNPPPIDPGELRGHVADAIAILPAVRSKLQGQGPLGAVDAQLIT